MRPAEREIYEQIWDRPEYRRIAPGELMAKLFLNWTKPEKGSTVIDFGCGTGRGARILAQYGLSVTGVDFAQNCLDKGVAESGFKFLEKDLTKPIGLEAEYGFCTDVMEHIPPEDVLKVLRNVRACVEKAFFNISTLPDNWGSRLVGHELHLTIEQPPWWREQLKRAGFEVLHEYPTEGCAIFYAA